MGNYFFSPTTMPAESLQRLYMFNVCWGIMTGTIIMYMLYRIAMKSSTLSMQPFPCTFQVNECDSAEILFVLYPAVVSVTIMIQSHLHMEYHMGGIIKEEPEFILKITGCQWYWYYEITSSRAIWDNTMWRAGIQTKYSVFENGHLSSKYIDPSEDPDSPYYGL